MQLSTDVDVILVEWHHVSMQLQSHVPSIDDTVKSICSVLDAHSILKLGKSALAKCYTMYYTYKFILYCF